MKKIALLVATAALALLAPQAFAQDQGGQVIGAGYDWICSNRSTVEPILETVFGSWIATHVTGAILKKYGVTKLTPYIGKALSILRILNLDVTPPPAVIVKQAANIIAASPEIVAASGASPTRMAAAADALKKV